MTADSLPCRRCGKVSGDVVTIYGIDQFGALVPRQAQCRGRCRVPIPAPEVPRLPRPAQRDPEPITAKRPGRCSVCPRAIAPGDVVLYVSPMGYMHFECAPAR